MKFIDPVPFFALLSNGNQKKREEKTSFRIEPPSFQFEFETRPFVKLDKAQKFNDSGTNTNPRGQYPRGKTRARSAFSPECQHRHAPEKEKTCAPSVKRYPLVRQVLRVANVGHSNSPVNRTINLSFHSSPHLDKLATKGPANRTLPKLWISVIISRRN